MVYFYNYYYFYNLYNYNFDYSRWIEPNQKYYFRMYDSLLPQEDKQGEQREKELAFKQETYVYESIITGLPRRVQDCPKSESFSNGTFMKVSLQGYREGYRIVPNLNLLVTVG